MYSVNNLDRDIVMNIENQLKKYKSSLDKLRQQDNESWEKTFEQTCPHCNQRVQCKENSREVHSLIVGKLLLQEGGLKREMLKDEIISFLVCDATISWNANQNESNYRIDIRFAKKFPMAVTDSESNQGRAYINTRYIEEVRQYLSKVEKLIENGDKHYGIFSITTNIEDDEQSNLDDHYYRDHLIAQWEWKECEIVI